MSEQRKETPPASPGETGDLFQRPVRASLIRGRRSILTGKGVRRSLVPDTLTRTVKDFGGLLVACLLVGLLIGGAAFVTKAALDVAFVRSAPSQPRETPWVWQAPSPVGGGCVVFGDQLGTCFTVEAP